MSGDRPPGQASDRPPQRFTRDDRIRNKRDFDRVYAGGRRGTAPGVVVLVADSPSGRHRLGLSISRKAGGAVRRNRIKRRLREAFRLHRGRIPGGLDIVVNGRTEVADMPFEELAESLLAAVRRAAGARPRAMPQAARSRS